MTEQINIRISIPDEDVTLACEAIRPPNSASPEIDRYDAVRLIQTWAEKAPTFRSWIDTASGSIVISDCPEGHTSPVLREWTVLPDGLFGFSGFTAPWAPHEIVIHEVHRELEDAPVLEQIRQLLGQRELVRENPLEALREVERVVELSGRLV